MTIESLKEMTVIELRKLAKENGVKLSAGISKDGIVERLYDHLGALNAAPDQANPLALAGSEPANSLGEAALAADVTNVSPGTGYVPRANQQPTYRQAWQARIPTPPTRQPMRDTPSWQAQRAPAAHVNRFGPAAKYAAPAEAREPAPAPVEQPMRYSAPTAAPTPAPKAPAFAQDAPRLDGYRLGYRAAPQRQDYSRPSYDRQDGYRRPENRAPYTPRPSYPQSNGFSPMPQESIYNDSVYKPMRDPAFSDGAPTQIPELLQLAPAMEVRGILEIMPDGYGFLRADTLLPSKKDIYVSVAQIRRFDLRTGDDVSGQARLQRETDKFAALMVVDTVNGQAAVENPDRLNFDELTAVYPNKRIKLEIGVNSEDIPMRLIDLIAPIGFGQRAMIVAPPEAGKTVLLREMCNAVIENDPNAQVMMLLIDERPEEVTLIRDAISDKAEVFATTFEESPDNQTRVAETMLERAERLVEQNKNVVILLDSLTKLTRAYQSSASQGGRTYTNTVSPASLIKPKRFFGAARNTRDGGSLTVIATISVDTGSRVDDIIFEEFKGTANMELWLVSPSDSDPIFPVINLQKSGTRKDDSLMNREEMEGLKAIRSVLSSVTNQEALSQLIAMMNKTKCNQDLFAKLKDWIAMWEKSGFLVKR